MKQEFLFFESFAAAHGVNIVDRVGELWWSELLAVALRMIVSSSNNLDVTLPVTIF